MRAVGGRCHAMGKSAVHVGLRRAVPPWARLPRFSGGRDHRRTTERMEDGIGWMPQSGLLQQMWGSSCETHGEARSQLVHMCQPCAGYGCRGLAFCVQGIVVCRRVRRSAHVTGRTAAASMLQTAQSRNRTRRSGARSVLSPSTRAAAVPNRRTPPLGRRSARDSTSTRLAGRDLISLWYLDGGRCLWILDSGHVRRTKPST